MAMSILLFHDREGIERLALAAGLPVEGRGGGRRGGRGERGGHGGRRAAFWGRRLHAERVRELLVVRLSPVRRARGVLKAAVLPHQTRPPPVEQLCPHRVPRDRSGEQE